MVLSSLLVVVVLVFGCFISEYVDDDAGYVVGGGGCVGVDSSVVYSVDVDTVVVVAVVVSDGVGGVGSAGAGIVVVGVVGVWWCVWL